MKEVRKERYVEIDNKIVDTEKNELLLFRSTLIKRLNKQEALIRHKARHIDAMIDILNEEIDKADNEELKKALIRISNIEMEL